ncbi:T-complex protein 1 subunit delta [Paramicrosporidium saccamoebae]|uniref:T-complex protein 1 subunit delta n=1 Tax=Paramicrosporidium saccamoebae TaxID=1246581 RepID=A0A2H9TQA7_9FUNG|nr:T-complex protein 1 subunit delta [Paramicrosporidium saccamoebae]
MVEAAGMTGATGATGTAHASQFSGKEKPTAVRISNIMAAKAVADVIRTSLGPRGMDKMIKTGRGETLITNDGATILKHMNVVHPCSKMLVELAEAQDVVAGDGTTSVVVLAGSLLTMAEKLLERGVHPSTISDAFRLAAEEAVRVLRDMAVTIRLDDRETLLKSAITALNSKVVSQYGTLIAGIAVDAVLRVVDPQHRAAVDVRDVRVVKKVGGTIEDTELVEGLLLTQSVAHAAGGPTRMEKARIGLIQFQLSPPKTDMEGAIVISDYQQMDRVLQEERAYLLTLCKRIKKTGCNVLLVQKSILRDAVSELALQYLAKLKILLVTDIEREEIEFVAKTLNCRPIADIDSFVEEKLATAELVEEVNKDGARYIHVSGIRGQGRTVSIVCRGANALVLDENARSLHDALCVIRCLAKEPALIHGGGAPEVEIAVRLAKYATTLSGAASLAVAAFGEAMLAVPTILAENAGLQSVSVVTELRNWHVKGSINHGINVRKGIVSDMGLENVVQPLLVSTSAVSLAAETVSMILKIDDIVACR